MKLALIASLLAALLGGCVVTPVGWRDNDRYRYYERDHDRYHGYYNRDWRDGDRGN